MEIVVDTFLVECYTARMQMTPLKDRAILRGFAWRRRWLRTRLLDFPDAFRHTERLLICLPVDQEEARRAVRVVPELITCFQASATTVAGLPASAALCESITSPVRVDTISGDDRRWSGLPSSALVDRITGDGLNAAVDLNPDLDVMTAALCLQSGAPLRMCFQGRSRDLFFNVQIAVSSEAQSDDANHTSAGSDASQTTPYTRLLNTIRGMMGKSAEGELTR